jgi:diadenosine tetraphosphate (Ap4A) HIT family hydrolase
MTTDNCIFCQIVAQEMPAYVVWEDETHLAFLSIFPNTDGFTVVIPKKHYDSYAFAQEDQVLADLIIATKKVANVLDNYFEDTARTGMFFEGFGIDHLHSKLFPMHGTGDMKAWANIESGKMNKFFKLYPGYLSSNDSGRADDQQLLNLAREIRKSYQD